ncbi:MAG: RHS repeat-associated core domain-containing protein, partial [Prevotella sp.]|nr:RHS repeat-associated core domain-containing protein [Prevotella sp.]
MHQATGKNTQTEVYAYTYDHAGRLLTTTHQLTDGATVKPQVILAENTYDDLGRLKTNKKGGQANLNTTYAYNVRSWTKSITSPLFTETLYYNESYGGSVKQYNGNISAMSWLCPTESTVLRMYNYTYDNLSRLTKADYGENSTVTGRFNEQFTYDKHGNMLSIVRRGNATIAGSPVVDNLTIAYNGNQLKKVTDAATATGVNGSMDIKDYINTDTEYTYNANGAMNKDLNKGITDIQYNSLNLPRLLDIKSPVAEGRNEYTYTASGVKLKSVQKWNPNYSTTPVIGSAVNVSALTMTKTTDYAGNIIYENNALKRILVEGG